MLSEIEKSKRRALLFRILEMIGVQDFDTDVKDNQKYKSPLDLDSYNTGYMTSSEISDSDTF